MNKNTSLLLGVFAGLLLALYGILQGKQQSLPEYAVASVNDSYISRATYDRAISALDQDKREALTDADRLHVLNRLIDEELLLQYGLQQGLVRSDKQVKSTLVSAVLQAKKLQAETIEVSSSEAEEFFKENQKLFSETERVRLSVIRVPFGADRSQDEARSRALEAKQQLTSGADFESVARGYHEGGALNLPNSLLPYAKLVDYLGPTLANAAFDLTDAETSEPIELGEAWQLLHVHERKIRPAPVFADVESLVIAEMRRRKAEDFVRQSLDGLRETENIVISETLR